MYNLKIIHIKNLIYRSEKRDESPRLKKMKRELAEAYSRLQLLEAKVVDAENDAEAKAEEVCKIQF